MNRTLVIGVVMAVQVVGLGLGTAWATNSTVSSDKTTGQQQVRAEDFERVVLEELSHRYGRSGHQVSLQVVFPKQVMEVPRGKLHLDVGEWSGGGRTGRRSFRVGVFVNRQFVKTVNVVVEVKAQAEVMTPVRWLKPQEVVGETDVVPMIIDVPSLTHDFVLNAEDVIGKQTLRPLPPRQPIRKNLLDHPPAIHKGDRVLLEVRNGGLLVQAVGIANASGKPGDTISVKNHSSGREVVGTVLSAGLVEVGF